MTDFATVLATVIGGAVAAIRENFPMRSKSCGLRLWVELALVLWLGVMPLQARAESAPLRLTVGTTADMIDYNPLTSDSRTDRWILDLMYPSLMRVTEDGGTADVLAVDWQYADEGRIVRLKIRDDFRWSDGVPITAEDVAFTIEAIKRENLGVTAASIPAFEAAKVLSPTEVEFRLSRPDGTFKSAVGLWMPIVPAHVFGKVGQIKGFANDHDWVSAGPYRLVKVERGQRYVMERVDSYPMAPNGRPTLDEVVFRVFPDVNAEVLALRNGDLDLVANTLPPNLARSLENNPTITLQPVKSLGFAHIEFNLKRSPLDQVEVRQAIAHAINYDAIRRVVLRGAGLSSDSSVLTPTLKFWHDPSVTEYSFDPNAARALLAKAGISHLSVSMVYDQADPYIASWAQIFRDSAAEAGIEIKLNGMERNTYLQRTHDHDFEIYAGSWSIMDNPPSYLGFAFKTGAFVNFGQLSDPALDKLIDRAQEALTPEAALDPVREAAKLIHDEVYDDPLYVQEFRIAFNASRWTGFEVQPSDLLSIVNPQSLARVTAVPAK
ncbi:MAG TPA: ABC transporter substrate-binding protein [Aliidongia sp.]|nr:ABC transporter substrate-binding protein [Aliidongia sp.]